MKHIAFSWLLVGALVASASLNFGLLLKLSATKRGAL